MFLSRVSALAVARVLRPHLSRNSPGRPSQNLRYLSTTTPLCASEPRSPFDNDSLSALTNSETFKKLSNSPEAILAIQKLAQFMHKQGVDLTSGTPPSMIQMSKLVMNAEFREASQNVIEEFKKAGIDLNNKAMISEFMSLMKKDSSPKS
ncbi:hypothetical protein GALMADRAFT_219171 [Galerina marginata CBS 339.88]|uniref:Uncharacterized protein n=1 Tax=Galerina marginata (strain CBS 339.88) TaxID=685588 RepID=A0A067TJC6_GALM3|nr:hypothetical protein GALMADRAFT_219171 [Galerina marginata CBS 339.88]